jgi:hypothetical protein
LTKKKTLIDDLWSVSEFIGNKIIDGFKDGQNTPNEKKLSILIRRYFYTSHITNKNKALVMPTVRFFF